MSPVVVLYPESVSIVVTGFSTVVRRHGTHPARSDLSGERVLGEVPLSFSFDARLVGMSLLALCPYASTKDTLEMYDNLGYCCFR